MFPPPPPPKVDYFCFLLGVLIMSYIRKGTWYFGKSKKKNMDSGCSWKPI